MKTTTLDNRHHIFTYDLGDWDLNLHAILAAHNSYVIDTGLGSDSVAPVQALLAEAGKPVIVINTHHHWDHIWGNGCFPQCPIISHPLCRDTMAKQEADIARQFGTHIQGSIHHRLPTLTFTDELYFPEDGIRLFYAPGHTADSISIYDEISGVLDAGDNIGDTLEEIVPSLETSMDVYRASVQKYLDLKPAACITGHNASFAANLPQLVSAAIGKA